ncbi:plastidic glucose transporter 4 [Tanacetum coccineum]
MGTVAKDENEFNILINQVTGISESLLKSFYILGLKPLLQCALLRLAPTTLGEVFSIACIMEARFETIVGKKLNIKEKIKIILSWPREEAPPVIKGFLDANEDISVFDIGESNVESMKVRSELSKFLENKESVGEVVMGGGEVLEVDEDESNKVISVLKDGGGKFDHSIDEINVGLSKEFVIKVLEGKDVSGVSLVVCLKWVYHEKSHGAAERRRVLCYVQGKARRKKKKAKAAIQRRSWDPGLRQCCRRTNCPNDLRSPSRKGGFERVRNDTPGPEPMAYLEPAPAKSMFFFKMELCVLGIHEVPQAGIDFLPASMSPDKQPMATSVIVSCGYEDDEDSGDVIVYTRHDEQDKNLKLHVVDQKLEGGNLGMERSMQYGIEVRVVRGLQYKGGPSEKLYVYDGIYKVTNAWLEDEEITPLNSPSRSSGSVLPYVSVASLGAILFGYHLGVVNGALEYLVKDLGIVENTVLQGWVVSTLLAGATVGSFTGGHLQTILEEQKLLYWMQSHLQYNIQLLQCLTQNVETIIIGRLLSGFGIGISSAILWWRGMFGIAVIPSVLLALGMAFSAESPRWLVQSTVFQVVSVGAALFLFQQLAGINAVVYYSTLVFRSAGVSSDVAASALVGAANVIGTMIASSLMDKKGRKSLLITSFSGMAASMLLLSLSFTWKVLTPFSGPLAVIGTVLYVLSFSLGAGPVPALLLPEIFASRIRAKVVALSLCMHWITNFFIGLCFLSVVTQFGISKVYLGFASICILAVMYIASNVVETKGRSLEDIERELSTPI